VDKSPLPDSVTIVHTPTLQGTPRVAGAYWIGGISRGVGFCLERRPSWMHRQTMRLVFGWEWKDADGGPR
jgi:hypothetical protein